MFLNFVRYKDTSGSNVVVWCRVSSFVSSVCCIIIIIFYFILFFINFLILETAFFFFPVYIPVDIAGLKLNWKRQSFDLYLDWTTNPQRKTCLVPSYFGWGGSNHAQAYSSFKRWKISLFSLFPCDDHCNSIISPLHRSWRWI